MNIERLAFFIVVVLLKLSDAEHPEGEYGKDYVYFMDDNNNRHYVNLRVSEKDLNISQKSQIIKRTKTDVRFWLYTRNNPTEYEELYVDHLKYNDSRHYLRNEPLLVLIHGWVADGNSNSTQLIKNAVLLEHGHNIVVVDWREQASWDYISAIYYLPNIGKEVSSMILALANRYSFNGSNVHVIGHSLGAQAGSCVCQSLKEFNFTAARLTGLDPARPLFEFLPLLNGISAEDATFVDILHTDGGMLGLENQAGHVDFFPNDGYNQPGCKNVSDPDSCRHSMAYIYYAESMLLYKQFMCQECDSYTSYEEGKCSHNDFQYMGYYCLSTARGKYYGDSTKNSTVLIIQGVNENRTVA